jgi:hypothetical protein
MTATVPLFKLMGIDSSRLLKEELLILEAELFLCILNELKEIYRGQCNNYFRLMKLTKEMENSMLDADFLSLIIKDILSTQEYTLQGIAEYIDFHEDILVDIVTGKNQCPSSMFLKRIIELHRSVRLELYQTIMKKIAMQFV